MPDFQLIWSNFVIHWPFRRPHSLKEEGGGYKDNNLYKQIREQFNT